MFAKLFAKKKERPYLKLCVKCGGKGQLSYFNQFQEKTYGPCEHCSNGHIPTSLGISLKCRCQERSVDYVWIKAAEVQHFKRGLEKADVKELVATQKQLGAGGTAVLLLCDNCNARYICQDGAGQRRRIHGDKELNEADKEFNRHIANTMISHGILKELTTTDHGVVVVIHGTPAVDAAQQQRPGSAGPSGETPTQAFGAVRSGGRLRPMSAPAPGMRQEPLFQHVGLPEQQAEADAAARVTPTRPAGLAPLVIDHSAQQSAADTPTETPAAARLRPMPNANTPVTPVHVQ
uniref:Uncharacterized protein n=1 Tax=Chlamydomonas leiostraca TaxID=1034604 RepID=A0A7S0RVC3_9CHLO|mmetsp:Transcript_31211/g.79574  ORF Transcript_31211/g.79574 Transcript_31211/m.79574 type:complete len:291 (+) Transcript_31211:172-1044(+)|eukprot:CAMPEP_0202858868 /NCGR_PEP_ID=MMETSP1391-20130828/1214_1 /ASSEMBLY_ACC=CAM_ASM_000867 /TAXON_ID=1034604 /ORGANISM="Chlamydomonas leiostraca, Strain SAG 11-49" /LENGTH=290 /DNA_ID=CAMNT_0049537833 /DNA_START=172 /DNA_END=1044 /DNA_ORIENTATION=-